MHDDLEEAPCASQSFLRRPALRLSHDGKTAGWPGRRNPRVASVAVGTLVGAHQQARTAGGVRRSGMRTAGGSRGRRGTPGCERPVNAWLACASVLLVAGLFPVVWGVSTGPLGRGVVAQNFGTSVVCLVMLLLAEGYGRPAYTDLALVLAVLGPVGTLVYTAPRRRTGRGPAKGTAAHRAGSRRHRAGRDRVVRGRRPGASGSEARSRRSSARRRKRDFLTDTVRHLPEAERGPT